MAAEQTWRPGDYRLEWDSASFALRAYRVQTLWQTRCGAMFVHEHHELLCRQQQLDSVYADPASLAESPTSYMLGDQFLVAPVLEPGV
ncbi:hypothetical protein ACIPK7_23175 [Pseudomonas sp. NPDC086581]|uniref:hypothetical protein n=1 Tax=Pseudomonas sp. NPDC086581 TaxID=3364432 RepID=UPI00380C02E5